MCTVVVLCSCPDAKSAERIALAMVEERLAACVNVLPGVTSVYRWQDEVTSESEVLLLIKTSAARYPALETRLAALHPYEVPEIIALPIAAGLPAYLNWLAAETE